MDGFVLKIKGAEIAEWRSFYVLSSMASISGMFSGVIPEHKFGFDTSVMMGDECVGTIGGKAVFTGYIDEIINSYGSQSAYVKISGRDKTADLVDCSFSETANEWRNQKAAAIIRNLCKPFGVNVAIDKSAEAVMATVIKTFKADEGETPFEELARLCRDLGVLAISYGDGKLTITKSTADKYLSDTITVGQNAEEGILVCSNRNRYSKYFVKGQGNGADSVSLADFINPSAQTTDPVIARYRPLTIFAENASDVGKCKSRAYMEAYVRAGYSRALTYKLRALLQSNGQPWGINQLARVSDDTFGINETMLVCAVEFVSDMNAQYANAMLVSSKTFLPSAKTNDIKFGYDR